MGLNLEPAVERAAIGGRRMHRATFYGLVRELAPHIEMQDTRFRKCIAPDHRIAITLWHVAHSGSACNVTGDRFGVGTSTVHGIILRVCKAIFRVMSYRLAFPAGQALGKVIQGICARRSMPNIVGAIDCTHIEIMKPTTVASKGYFDREKRFSMTHQALVDCRGRFIDVFAGWPGSVHDARVFANSSFNLALQEQRISHIPLEMIRDVPMRPYIIGDAGYALMPQVIVPYPGRNLPVIKDKFNFWHFTTRMTVEKAFGRLKGCWRWLGSKVRIRSPEVIPYIIVAACILHNVVEEANEPYTEFEEDDEVMARRLYIQDQQAAAREASGVQARAIRDKLDVFMINAN